MIAKKMVKYVEGSSVIRAMFEEGKKMAAKYGAEMYMISVWVIRAHFHLKK